MALELLKCTICPRQPYFSDTSHLLTHVGSKGHLSHLHKLQVRSHGDIEASQQLAIYNSWYLEHHLAELLAERLRHKQSKQAAQRITTRRPKAKNGRNAIGLAMADDIPLHLIQPHDQLMIPLEQDAHKDRLSKRRIMQEEMDDPDYVPPLPVLDFLAASVPHTYAAHCLCEDPLSHASDCFLSPSFPQPLDYTRLKGQVWPGMDVFDSATEEQARKRNQRKDHSVVKTMLANSMMIKPWEMTFARDGSLKRKRHLDDLDDETNLVEGESPIKRLSIKRPKRDLSREEHRNTARGIFQSMTPKVETFFKSTPPSANSITTSPSILARFLAERQSLPPVVVSPKKRGSKKQKKGPFSVLQDTGAGPASIDRSSHFQTTFLNPASEYRYAKDVDISLDQLPWSQPASAQLPQYDPFKDYGRNHAGFSIDSHPDEQKENANPPACKQEFKDEYSIEDDPVRFSSLYDLSPDLGALSHVYAYTRNPLMEFPAYPGRTAIAAQDLPPLR